MPSSTIRLTPQSSYFQCQTPIHSMIIFVCFSAIIWYLSAAASQAFLDAPYLALFLASSSEKYHMYLLCSDTSLLVRLRSRE